MAEGLQQGTGSRSDMYPSLLDNMLSAAHSSRELLAQGIVDS